MPFDGTTIDPKIAARLKLIEALRAEMPSGFIWDFANWYYSSTCGTAGCACGLAVVAGIVPRLYLGKDDVLPSTVVGRAIGLHARTAAGIFVPEDPERTYGVKTMRDVTPTMVADKLEATLA